MTSIALDWRKSVRKQIHTKEIQIFSFFFEFCLSYNQCTTQVDVRNDDKMRIICLEQFKELVSQTNPGSHFKVIFLSLIHKLIYSLGTQLFLKITPVIF